MIAYHKINNLLILLAYEFVFGFIAIVLEANLLSYLIFSWGLPTFYFLSRIKSFRLKWLTSSLFWGIPAALIIDFWGHYNKSWSYWDNPKFSVTGLELIGIPIESFIWGISFWLFHIVIYEYFFDKHRTHKSRRLEKYGTVTLFAIGVVAVVLHTSGINVPELNFYYLFLIILYTLVSLLILSRYPQLLRRALFFGMLSLILGMIVELVSLTLGLWTFPGSEFITKVPILQHLVPIEEVIWWFIIPVAICLIHEAITDTGD